MQMMYPPPVLCLAGSDNRETAGELSRRQPTEDRLESRAGTGADALALQRVTSDPLLTQSISQESSRQTQKQQSQDKRHWGNTEYSMPQPKRGPAVTRSTQNILFFTLIQKRTLRKMNVSHNIKSCKEQLTYPSTTNQACIKNTIAKWIVLTNILIWKCKNCKYPNLISRLHDQYERVIYRINVEVSVHVNVWTETLTVYAKCIFSNEVSLRGKSPRSQLW